jgi:TetR/AcrR family transcriptional repressor of mexJK operon
MATRHGSRRSPRLGSGAAIREAAAALFLERGYQATSLDDIAAAARVSKQTIYTHFSNKEELFADLVLGNAERVEEFNRQMAEAVRGKPVDVALRDLARLYARTVGRPEVLRLRRLVIAEAGRFPELARTYYERVPGAVYAGLTAVLRALSEDGQLHLEDASTAAQHLAWLVVGATLDRGMFLQPNASAEAEIDSAADAAVRVFLRAYVGA